MLEEVKLLGRSSIRECLSFPSKYTIAEASSRICNYLSKTNVQLGASYAVGQKSNALYSAGFEAAAKYINASPDNIG